MPTTTQELRALELLTLVSYGRVSTTMRAMPFVAPARHVVADGDVLLRMHAGHGYHRACAGGVVAFGADNFNVEGSDLWSVQLTGTAQIIEPTPGELELFGPVPSLIDGEPYEPAYMRLTPQFFSVHTLDYSAGRQTRHAV
ncbi:pyridoxamine 5'-phosphate oxidase family protein [Streptomyces sp. NBC_01317]|uniref:pyridoxamine 5'-phosphate oxidase family protein n=1 Tax=Streptomyces sp. NBC_01317 TaxID=2903822 RepID=UPI002E1172EA|nr:pyridoxamine 5'-phosphate oxidase family protein [Streptomyces sp. NBC_01317]